MTTSGDIPINSFASPSASSRRGILHRAAEAVVAALYPPRCALCGASVDALSPLCPSCEARLPRLAGPRCARCGERLTDPSLDICIPCGTRTRFIDAFRALGSYDSAWGALVRMLKFEQEPAIGRFLGYRLAQLVRSDPIVRLADCVVYVPMHRFERKRRGFNQAELIARTFGRRLGLPVVRALRKTRETEPQGRLTASARRTNLEGAFRSRECDKRHALLVDDICTTGSTLEACAEALKQGGFSSVTALAVARA